MFLEVGYFTYMGKYVKELTKIATHMTNLLKDIFEKITWTIDCHASSEALKKPPEEVLVWKIISPLKGELDLCTEASDIAIGIILMHKSRIIAYSSKRYNNDK